MKAKLLFLFFLFSISSFAKSDPIAITILNKASDVFEKSNGITVKFIFKTKNNNTKAIDTFEGELKMKGKKFLLESQDIKTWFDGKNQWSMLNSTNEVNLTIPTDAELQAINPTILFKIYKNGFSCYYLGEKKSGNKVVDEIELVPEMNRTDLERIVLTVDRNNNLPESIIMYNKNKTINDLKIVNLQTKMNHPDIIFVFNKNKHPGCEIIDLR